MIGMQPKVGRRIVILGSSGNGKSTLARALAAQLGITHVELDQLFHQPGWEPTPTDEFRQKIAAALDEADAQTDGWVVCGNYTSGSGGLHHERADTIIWLNLAAHVFMRRLAVRTVRRALTREELWNGNREPLTNFYSLDPQKNVILYAWTTRQRLQKQYEEHMSDGTWAHASVVHLTSPRQVNDLLASTSTSSASGSTPTSSGSTPPPTRPA